MPKTDKIPSFSLKTKQAMAFYNPIVVLHETFN